jgi:hypothetical protein
MKGEVVDMKILINYDLINALRNVNEPLSPFKVLRNEKYSYLKCYIPLYLGIDSIISPPSNIMSILFLQMAYAISFDCVLANLQHDHYKGDSKDNLLRLSNQLNDLNVKTNYELLSKSNYDGKVINLEFNKNKIPSLVETKYILVPSYDYKGDIKDTRITQEHELGTHEYVLSLGSKQKKYKVAYANL